LKRLVSSLAALGLVLVLVGPQTAFARMHFTTTNERLDALTQAANSSLALTDPAAVQTQINEITTQAQAAKAAAEDAATRPASNAQDKAVLATVSSEMDAVAASAAKAKAATGADQMTALQDVQKRATTQSQAGKTRTQEHLAAPPAQPVGSPGTLPNSGQASTSSGLGIMAAVVGGLLLIGGVGAIGAARRRRGV